MGGHCRGRTSRQLHLAKLGDGDLAGAGSITAMRTRDARDLQPRAGSRHRLPHASAAVPRQPSCTKPLPACALHRRSASNLLPPPAPTKLQYSAVRNGRVAVDQSRRFKIHRLSRRFPSRFPPGGARRKQQATTWVVSPWGGRAWRRRTSTNSRWRRPGGGRPSSCPAASTPLCRRGPGGSRTGG